jgi:hypothetical protein
MHKVVYKVFSLTIKYYVLIKHNIPSANNFT